MSYDIWIEGGESALNITSNIGHVFYDHMKGGIHALHGKTGAECLPIIKQFWINLDHTRIKLRRVVDVGEPFMSKRYDSPNGWGSLIGAMIFMAQIQSMCAEFPQGKVELSA